LRYTHFLIKQSRQMCSNSYLELPVYEKVSNEYGYMNMSNLPQRPASNKSFMIPYFQVVSCFLKIKKYCNSVLFIDECLTNKNLQANKLISCTTLFPKTTLNWCDQFELFQVPDESGVYHTFHNLAQATS